MYLRSVWLSPVTLKLKGKAASPSSPSKDILDVKSPNAIAFKRVFRLNLYRRLKGRDILNFLNDFRISKIQFFQIPLKTGEM